VEWKCLAKPEEILTGKRSFDLFGCRLTSLKMTALWLEDG